MAQFLKVICSTAGQEQTLIQTDQIVSVTEVVGGANTVVTVQLAGPTAGFPTYTITGPNSADGVGAFAKVVNDAIIANPGGVVSTIGYPLTTAQVPAAQSGAQGRILITGEPVYLSFTASFNALPALKLATLDAAIWMVAPVCGLRPLRALRCFTIKVPKPTRATCSPFFSSLVILSNTASSARPAEAFGRSAAVAIASISSVLFTIIPLKVKA